MPNEADIYAPQVFHGIKGDVIVPESSSALDKFLAANFLLLNSARYILPGNTIEIY